MKNKVIQKFFTVLLGLVMVGPGWAATQYCQTPVQSTVDNTTPTIIVSVYRVSGTNKVHLEFESNLISGIRGGGTFQQWGDGGVWKNQDDAVANFSQNWVHSSNVFSKEFEFSTYPTSGSGKIYVLFDLKNESVEAGQLASAGFTLTDVDLSASCDGTPSDLKITSSTDLELEVNATSQISHTTSSTGAITYSSSNAGVATVDASGLITAIKGGKATITVAQEADDTYAAGSKKINVNIPRLSQCSGDVGHFGNPTVKRIHYEIEYKDNAINYTVTGLNSHKIDFLEIQTTTGNYSVITADSVSANVATYKQTGVTEGEEIGIRFLYSTDEIGGNEMNSENVNLDDPNIIYYKVGDCEAADPGLLPSDLTLTSEAEVEIAINATSQISYTTTSTGAVTYSSSKESVATVSNSGLITAHKGGKATITVSQAADATYNAGSLTVEVTVPEIITQTTFWGLGSNNGVDILYSITRNTNKTLTYNIKFYGDKQDISSNPYITIDGVEYQAANCTWTSEKKYETDIPINGTIKVEYAGGAAVIDYSYTVGAENEELHLPLRSLTMSETSASLEIGGTKTLTVTAAPAEASNSVTWTSNAEGVATVVNGVVTAVAEGTATITATSTVDDKITATCAVTVLAKVLTEPDALPTAPTYPAEQVKAVYSATYGADCNFGNWGGGTGNEKQAYGWKFYDNNYFGLVDFTHNCSQMEALHMDIWVAENVEGIKIAPINGGAPEQLKQLTLEGQKWNSIDIPMTEFTNDKDFSNVYQIKFDNLAGKVFWVNNVYFYTTQTKTTCALSASVKGGEGGTASVDNAEVNKGGTATFTAEAACGYSFVGWWNNTTKVSTEATYTPTDIQEDLSLVAEFAFVGPSEAATVPSYDLVVPIYTNGTPAEGVSMTTSWGQRTIQNSISVAGHTMFKYGNISYQGIAFENNVRNVSTMQYIHLDIWSTETGIIKFFLIWPGQGNETSVTVDLIGCQWNSINIPLNKFSGADLTQIHQFKLDAQTSTVGEGAIDGATILVQDIFFYAPNEFTLSEEEDNAENLTIFNGKVCDVTIARSFTADNLYTLALPFDMTEAQVEETFGACTMYALAESYWKVEGENMYIRFAPVTEFKANTPILFTPTEDIENAVAEGVTIENATCETSTELVTFHGTYSKMDLAAPNYILAADQYLYPVVDDDYSINGMRGYFSWGAAVTGAPKMARVILHEEITTDNALVPAAQGTTKKVMENGRFVIIRDGVRYGILGVEE